jgi:competence protein ComEA
VKIKLYMEPVNNWLGFTRRERRSTSILLAIIFIIIGFRYVVPEQNIKIENWGPESADTEIIHEFDETDIISGKLRHTGDIRKVFDESRAISENQEHNAVSSSVSFLKASSSEHLQQKPLVEINSCDSLSLIALPGIGPVLSVRIIKYRNLLGGFARVEQLKEVYGLPDETYEMIKGKLYADTSGIRKINVNSAGYKELSRIHYLEKYEVTAILKYIKLAGKATNMKELIDNKILPPDKADKVEPYLDFK